MRGKKYLGAALAVLLFSACNNTSKVEDNYVAGKLNDPYKIMEAKREHYKKIDKIKAEQERQLQLKKEKEEKARLKAEKEKLKNMAPIEKLKLKAKDGMKKIEAMTKIATDARQEEINNAKDLETVKTAVNKALGE